MDTRNQALEYIRGIAMLSVVGIHTGAYSLSNPDVNVHLFALLEIVTRFSIPVFFFISAFGLFYKQNLNNPFDFYRFLLRRSRGVLIPYIVWSAFYMLHYTWVSGDSEIWSASTIYEYFFFGLASYQLYFLVILMWFYLLMPFWRVAVKYICQRPVRNLGLILILQIAFNYYSSYILVPASDNYYLNLLLQHRLSYLVFHYIFIFLLGGVCAIKALEFQQFVIQKHRLLNYAFAASLVSILAHYYLLLYKADYSPEAAVNTVHQLSPTGILYTIASTFFLYAAFTAYDTTGRGVLLKILGKYSYPVYLVHPLVMYYLSDLFTANSIVMSTPVTILFFLLTTTSSLAFGFIIHRASRTYPTIGGLLLGTRKSAKMGTQ